jgi:hypothetical protein
VLASLVPRPPAPQDLLYKTTYEPYDVVHDAKCSMMHETRSNLPILPTKHFTYLPLAFSLFNNKANNFRKLIACILFF